MGRERIHYGRCSFIPPDGFLVQEEASLLNGHCGGDNHCPEVDGKSISITLVQAVTKPEVPDYSENPLDMTEDAYPTSITLTTLAGYGDTAPEDYLRRTCDSFKNYLNDFRMDFCVRDNIKGYPAAQAQCSFSSNFRIFLLYYSLSTGDDFLNTVMLTPEAGVKKWRHIFRLFVESVRIQ